MNKTIVSGSTVIVRVYDAHQRGEGWHIERGREWPVVFLAPAYDSIDDLANSMAADAEHTEIVEVEIEGDNWRATATAEVTR